jgi:membrane-associated phospholipid phosphatase
MTAVSPTTIPAAANRPAAALATSGLKPIPMAAPPSRGEHLNLTDQPGHDQRWWRAALPHHPWLWVSALLIACGWDRAVWLFVAGNTAPVLEYLESMTLAALWANLTAGSLARAADAASSAVYHAVKFFGTVWLPAMISAVIVLAPFFQPDPDRVRRGLRRGTLIFLCPALAGLAAEFLKLIFRRERPEFGDGLYTFRLADLWSTSGLGLPSSHAAPAVATALALAAVFPRFRWAFAAPAALCCVSRVLAGAHYLSDALAGALVGLTIARAIIALDLHNNRGTPVAA